MERAISPSFFAATIPATQSATVALLIFMLSGSLAGTAIVLRHKDRRMPAVVCVLLAVGIAVSGGLLLGGQSAGVVSADNFDPSSLPPCQQAGGSPTPTATTHPANYCKLLVENNTGNEQVGFYTSEIDALNQPNASSYADSEDELFLDFKSSYSNVYHIYIHVEMPSSVVHYGLNYWINTSSGVVLVSGDCNSLPEYGTTPTPTIPTITPGGPTLTPSVTPSPTATPAPIGCLITLTDPTDYYPNPYSARTARFAGDPFLGKDDPPSGTYPANATVYVVGQYGRGGYEQYVYLVNSVYQSGSPTPIPTDPNNYWIYTREAVLCNPQDYSLPPSVTDTFIIQREDLRDYGVDIHYDSSVPWLNSELSEVLDGVEGISLAFQMFTGASSTPLKQLFWTVMIPSGVYHDYIHFRRNPNSQICQFFDTGENNVDPTDATKLPIHIECGVSSALWGQSLQDETAIHELGHLFDSRSDKYLYGIMDVNQYALTDCNSSTIMGNGVGPPLGEWGRGLAGWGSISTSPTNISRFQQDPANFKEEAVADMFLNWVYRYTTGGVVTTSDECIVQTGNWDGFQNIDENGNFDAGLPGNARFMWMQTHMDTIFMSQGWN